MLFGFPGLVFNNFLFSSLNYDPIADFAPVSLIGTYANLLVVPNSSPVKTFQEFVARAKANPGRVTFASPGIGTSPHLAGELLRHLAGIDITHVPYRGAAAGATSDLTPAASTDVQHNRLAAAGDTGRDRCAGSR
jgi:tripartite-type tricarboxylate transporter receptor subunit TctC